MPTIRILQSEANKRGDLFGKLAADVFLTLGYEDLRFNIQKSGRELDVQGVHRTERRMVIAEFKATGEKVGGDQINKFVGAVDAEKREKKDYEISLYLVSLSGFTEAALEQEDRIQPPRIILFDAERIARELQAGRIICSAEDASLRVGQSPGFGPELRLRSTELLVHHLGWIWCLYFEQQKRVTHFSLVHADGEALDAGVAQLVIDSDASSGGSLNRLTYLAPPPIRAGRRDLEAAAQQRYFEYIAADFGEIELTGLPVDQEVGVRRLRLENLFVPLQLIESPTSQSQRLWEYLRDVPAAVTTTSNVVFKRLQEASSAIYLHDSAFLPPTLYDDDSIFGGVRNLVFVDSWDEIKSFDYKALDFSSEAGAFWNSYTQKLHHSTRNKVGEILSKVSRLAVLAPPGGGKSTLLKRLATAYAFPDRRQSLDDGLPDKRFIPLVLRCRQLLLDRGVSIVQITGSLARRAEMSDELAQAFVSLVSKAFRTGSALLLVDGLDEISDEGLRLSFAHQLRVFASMYPKVSLVVTSREAGFRAVAGALTSCCSSYAIAELDDDDIRRLTLAWHREVIGDREEVISEAESLAKAILATERVRQLAKNPLLLTTLLLVKRWVGQLPTRRSILYGKAIEVLLMTWNVEGHEPLDPEEVIPQLAYVAFVMMQEGVQRITARRLQQLLVSARDQMPELLSFAKLGISDFVERVELRSSLLIQSGHEVEAGTLLPVYEFRHLAFQEYLTAVALVEGYYPGRDEQESLVAALRTHLDEQRWKEVVPLAAVLSGRRVQPLIQWLLQAAEKSSDRLLGPSDSNAPRLLAECVADECSITPALLSRALEVVARHSVLCNDIMPRLLSTKYKEVFGEIVRKAYKEATSDLFPLANALISVSVTDAQSQNFATMDRLRQIGNLLSSSDEVEKSLGALLLTRAAFEVIASQLKFPERLEMLTSLGDAVASRIFEPEAHVQFSATWALVWLSNARCWSPARNPSVIGRLAALWTQSGIPEVRFIAAWALSRFQLLTHDLRPLTPDDNALTAFLRAVPGEAQPSWKAHDFTCSCVIGHYLRAPWSNDGLRKRAQEAYKSTPNADPFRMGPAVVEGAPN